MIKMYRTRPCEIEAIKWDGTNYGSVKRFTSGKAIFDPQSGHLNIDTLEGQMRANIGDFIIKGLAGEFYPCKPEIFNKKYVEI